MSIEIIYNLAQPYETTGEKTGTRNMFYGQYIRHMLEFTRFLYILLYWNILIGRGHYIKGTRVLHLH